MTPLQSRALPDHLDEPSGSSRGDAVVLGGIGESAGDFDLLVDQLSLEGIRVAVFDDVSLDGAAARVGARQQLQQFASSTPTILIGSDVGAALAADIAAEHPSLVTALVLADLATAASRPAGPRADDPRAVGSGSVGSGSAERGGAESRLPREIALPSASRVTRPTLLFHGNADDVTDVADAISWASELAFGAVRIVQRGDHHSLTGPARWTVAASIALFVERHRAGESLLADAFVG